MPPTSTARPFPGARSATPSLPGACSAALLAAATLPAALLLALALLAAPPLSAQEGTTPAPDPADVASVDAIVQAVYDVISGPAGEARDWDRFRSLFVPGAQLIPVGRRSEGAPLEALRWSVEDYVERSGPVLERRGFFEREIHRVTERFGPLVHVWSTYESRRRADDPEPFARGINSFQLLDDGSRLRVVNIVWAAEEDGRPIPERYLPGGM